MLIYILLAVIALSLVVAFGPWFKSYRTQIVGYLTVVWAAAAPLMADIFAYLKDLDWTQYVSLKTAPYVVAAVTVLFMVLRFRTTGSVGSGK